MKECPVCRKVAMVTIGTRWILSSSAEMTKAEPGTARIDLVFLKLHKTIR